MSIMNTNSILSLTITNFKSYYYFSILYYFLAPLLHWVEKPMPCFYGGTPSPEIRTPFFPGDSFKACHMNTTADLLLVVLFNSQYLWLDGIYHVSRSCMLEYSVLSVLTLTNKSEDIPKCSINKFFKATPFSSGLTVFFTHKCNYRRLLYID